MSDSSFCENVHECHEFDCDTWLCWDGLSLRPNISETTAAILYALFRILERTIFAYLAQVNRELLQVSISKRLEKSSFGCFQGRLPSGIPLQMLLRFLGTLVGVLSFVLILERNIWMFVSLIIIDTLGVALLSTVMDMDHVPTEDSLNMMQIADWEKFKGSGVDKRWLENFNNYIIARQQIQNPQKAADAVELKYF